MTKQDSTAQKIINAIEEKVVDVGSKSIDRVRNGS